MSTHKTENLFVEGQREDGETETEYVHRGGLLDLSLDHGPSVTDGS